MAKFFARSAPRGFNQFFNPLARLGIRQYSMVLPLLTTLGLCVLTEFIANVLLKDPHAVGLYAIFVFIIAILYFAFRDGIRGGLITTGVTIAYYCYIIVTRNYQGEQFSSGIQTTIVLGLLYVVIATLIGWLKEKIDVSVEQVVLARNGAEEGQLRLKTILDQLPVGVLLVDTQGYELIGNKQAEKILGNKIKTDISLLQSQQFDRVFKKEQILEAKSWPIVRAITKGETVIAEEMEYLRRDRKMVSLRVNAAPIINKNKKIIAAVSTLYDITQEKQLEKRKDDFVNMASHELKTPITSMKLYVDSLFKKLQKTSDPRTLKTITGIKKQTERLQELVNDLLDVSRIQTGKLHFNKDNFRLDELLAETIEALQETTRNQKIVYSKKTAMTVYGDRFRIYQVFTNLITNASKYSPEGTVITVKVKKEKGKVIVSVKDQGIGVSKDQTKKIFERLYQVSDSAGKTFPGLGMGLYISKEIIKRHRGTIWVESQKDEGSTFFFSIPIKKA